MSNPGDASSGAPEATTECTIRLAKDLEVKRVGKPVDSFAPSLSAKACTRRLRRKGGHTCAEFLHADAVTKFYFDTERYYPEPPGPEVLAAYEAEVRGAMDAIVGVLSCVAPDATYVLAERHGMVGTKPGAATDGSAPRHKLSFRGFVSGVAVVYHNIPRVMTDVAALRETWGLWDSSPYKAGEQMLSAIGGRKWSYDPRVLRPLGEAAGADGRGDATLLSPDRLLMYVASYVDPSWPVARAPDGDPEPPLQLPCGTAMEPGGAADPCIVRLVGLLGQATAADRVAWCNVGIFLKALDAGGDAYLGPWLAFSRLGGLGKYKNDADCVLTWRSFNDGDKRKRGGGAKDMTVGTLRYFAKRDSPLEYAAWRRWAATTLVDFAAPASAPPEGGSTGAVAAPAAGEEAALHLAQAQAQAEAEAAATAEAHRTGLLRGLSHRFPDLGLDESTFRVTKAGSGSDASRRQIEFRDAGMAGVIEAPRARYWGCTLSVTPHAGGAAGERQFMGLVHADVPFQGPVSDLHPNIPSKAKQFVFNHDAEDCAVLRSVTPNVEAIITLHRPCEEDSCVCISVPGKEEKTVATLAKVQQLKSRISAAVQQFNQNSAMPLFTNNGIIHTLNLTINAAADPEHAVAVAGSDQRPFGRLRDAMLLHAAEHKLRKGGGYVWRPVQGCPCAYKQAEEYRDFLNATLNNEPIYHESVGLHRDLVDYVTKYDPPSFHDIKHDRGIVSFRDGLLLLPMQPSVADTAVQADAPLTPLAEQVRFVPYDSAEAAAMGAEGRIARHHIDLPFVSASTGAGGALPATPLFDSVLASQFSEDAATALRVLLGRMLFPIGTHDNWQVMPFLIGTGGTGKSLVVDTVAAMYSTACLGALSGNHEQTFGLDSKFACHALLGRDLPRRMSSVLQQELLQSMVSGEEVCVPRKGLMAVTVRWTVPLLFSSNFIPDYADHGGQMRRRVVPFLFTHPVDSPDTTLLARIRATELPALMVRLATEYLAAADRHRGKSFWSWCPPELREAQSEMGTATSYVRRFLALTSDDDAADNGNGVRVYTRNDSGLATSLMALESAFRKYMDLRHPRVQTTETMDPATLSLCGYAVLQRANFCKSCNMHVLLAGWRCCAEYTCTQRGKGWVAKGLELVRECMPQLN